MSSKIGTVPGRRRTVPLVTGIFALLALLALPILQVHGAVVLASLGGACFQTNGCGTGQDVFFDGSPNGPGVCVTLAAGGGLSQAVWAGIGINAGTPTGTMQARIYSTSGSPGPSANCTPPVALLAVSNVLSLGLLSGSYQSFTFTFGSGGTLPLLTAGQNVIAVVMFNATDSGQIKIELSTQSDNHQNSVIFAGSWGDNAVCAANCEAYQLLADTQAPPPPTVSPYGTNPPSFPCCNPVTPQYLGGSAIRAPDVDPLPLELLFVILFALTLGSYLAVRTYRNVQSRQYEIHIARNRKG